MAYLGIQKQISRNNRNSVLLLIAFPALLLGMVYLFFLFTSGNVPSYASGRFVNTAPWVVAATAVWFLIAWKFNTSMINAATGARPLERRENKRVYNLVENLCIATGMRMPKVNVIEDDSLNAFASGISDSTYTVSLSRGIINKLDDDELEAVIAHELAHIRNRDVRLLIISIIFVGIFAFIANVAFRSLRFGAIGRSRGDGKNNAPVILIILVLSAIAYLISILLRFGISRSREYLADAGAAEMTRKPWALASALRKISGDPLIEAVQNKDVAQMFIENPQLSDKKGFSLGSLFATHPPIQKRIQVLEQFA
ncbi:MAG: M48 family metallopeptidase [Bacteroidota bacterium]